MGRAKRLSTQDEMMRHDGFVTAVEVSEATGLALSAVHRGIDEERIPGRTVKVSTRYSHRYVDIDKYVAKGTYKGAPTILANLLRLASAVAKAREAAPARSTPRAST